MSNNEVVTTTTTTTTTSPEGFAANATIDEDYALHADTMFGGRVIVAYNPGSDKYEGTVTRHDGTLYTFDDIGCPWFPLDPDENSMNNLLQVADIAIKDSEAKQDDIWGDVPTPEKGYILD